MYRLGVHVGTRLERHASRYATPAQMNSGRSLPADADDVDERVERNALDGVVAELIHEHDTRDRLPAVFSNRLDALTHRRARSDDVVDNVTVAVADRREVSREPATVFGNVAL